MILTYLFVKTIARKQNLTNAVDVTDDINNTI